MQSTRPAHDFSSGRTSDAAFGSFGPFVLFVALTQTARAVMMSRHGCFTPFFLLLRLNYFTVFCFLCFIPGREDGNPMFSRLAQKKKRKNNFLTSVEENAFR
jgi:hypothetical protein